MFVLQASISGDRIVIKGMQDLAVVAPEALKRGLRTSARGIYAVAHKNLEGSGRIRVKTHGNWKWRAAGGYQREGATKIRTTKDAGGNVTGMHSFLGARPGSYPVPIITGNLVGRLGILEPGESKRGQGDIGSFTAGELEFVVYDSAAYAYVIRDAKGSSRNHGPRDFLGDAVKTYDQTVGIARQVEDELQKEIDKR